MPDKFTADDYKEIIAHQSIEIERLEMENDKNFMRFHTLKKFMTVLFDETFMPGKIDVICDSDRISHEEILDAFRLIDRNNINISDEKI
jgi:hypothetical protein